MIEQKVKRIGLRLNQSLNEKLDRIAKKIGISKNELITDALWKYVQKSKK